MQDLHNVHLDPRDTAQPESELARVAKEESLRRRKNQALGGGAVQFSTIFAMIDSGLEQGAESLRKIPKRNAQKDDDAEKGGHLAIFGPAETKAPAAEAPKEAPKARTDQDQKPRLEKAAAAKKAESVESHAAQAAMLQATVETNRQQVIRLADRTDVKVDRRELKADDTPKAALKQDRRAGEKPVAAQTAPVIRESSVTERQNVQDEGRTQERRVKPKSKDAEDSSSGHREERRPAETSKAARPEDESGRASKIRERQDDKPLRPDRAETRESKGFERKPDDVDPLDKRRTEETGQAEAGAKKRGIADLEKLSGLHAKAALEFAPVIAPMPEIAFKAPIEAVRGLAVDAVKAHVKTVSASSSSAGTNPHAGADAQSHSSQSSDKLAQTARRLASYLSGRPEAIVKPEATFQDMVAKAKLFLENGRSEMTIQLKPEQLGSLNIKIVVEDAKMQAQFVTDRPEVKALIEQNEGLLKEKMAEVGIQISSLSVEVRSDTGTAQADDGRPSNLRRVTEFGSGDDSDLPLIRSDAQIAYALAGMGSHLSLVA